MGTTSRPCPLPCGPVHSGVCSWPRSWHQGTQQYARSRHWPQCPTAAPRTAARRPGWIPKSAAPGGLRPLPRDPVGGDLGACPLPRLLQSGPTPPPAEVALLFSPVTQALTAPSPLGGHNHPEVGGSSLPIADRRKPSPRWSVVAAGSAKGLRGHGQATLPPCPSDSPAVGLCTACTGACTCRAGRRLTQHPLSSVPMNRKGQGVSGRPPSSPQTSLWGSSLTPRPEALCQHPFFLMADRTGLPLCPGCTPTQGIEESNGGGGFTESSLLL